MKIILGMIFLLVIHLFILLNLQFTAWPEMFSYPYLLSKGFNPYKEIALPYQPLLPLIQSIYFGIFGYKLLALKVLTWGFIIVSDILIFVISVKLIGKKMLSILPLTIFIFLQPLMGGNGLWFDLALTPFVLAGILFYLIYQDKRGLFLLSFFLSIASLIKQQTATIFILLSIYFLILFWREKRLKDFLWFLSGTLIPIIFTFVYVLSKGVWTEYLFWTIIVPLFWYPNLQGYIHFPNIKDLTLLLLIFGPVLLFALTYLKKKEANFTSLLLIFLPLFITSFFRFELFRLQHALAVYIILFAFTIKEYQKYLSLILISSIMGIFLLLPHNLINVGKETRFFTTNDLEISSQIKNYSKNERIYLFGLSSAIYPLNNLLPPKPWIDNYVWYFEIAGMQDKLLDGFTLDPPKFIFRKKPLVSMWSELGVYEPGKVISYMKENYQVLGMIGQEIEIWTLRQAQDKKE